MPYAFFHPPLFFYFYFFFPYRLVTVEKGNGVSDARFSSFTVSTMATAS